MKTTTIYLTKYALTKGIITCKAEIDAQGYACVRSVSSHPKLDYRGLLVRPDNYSTDLAAAKVVAETKRTRAVKCAKRKVNVLESLKF